MNRIIPPAGHHLAAGEVRPRPQGAGHPVEPVRGQRRRRPLLPEQHRRLPPPRQEPPPQDLRRRLRRQVSYLVGKTQLACHANNRIAEEIVLDII